MSKILGSICALIAANLNFMSGSPMYVPTMANFVIFSDQIGMNGEVRKQERLDYLEEGRKVRQRIEDERLKVERIKKSKLDGLVGLGIEDKYQADLAKKRIL